MLDHNKALNGRLVLKTQKARLLNDTFRRYLFIVIDYISFKNNILMNMWT